MMNQSPIGSFPSIEGLIARYSARGLTNEQMSQNPILKDLTGNGHDITLHNFAWGGMSGIDGYPYNFDSIGKLQPSYIDLSLNNDHKVSFIKANGSNAQYSINGDFTCKIKVTGLSANIESRKAYKLKIVQGGVDANRFDITEDGEYDVDIKSPSLTYLFLIGIVGEDNEPVEMDTPVILEQLPLHKSALVSDGVDDYGICENFPILTKENGYTVVAVRKWLDVKASTPLLSNSADSSSGAFIIEESKSHCGSFGEANNAVNANEDNFVYQTSTSYNGQAITQGDDAGTNILNLFRNTNTGNNYASAALYDLLIYSRDLTKEEINQLREYFYIRDNNQKPLDSSLVDAWIFSGYKNEDAPDTIAGVNGIELTCNNFAWNEEGSGFKDGALWFDGVDDYLCNKNTPILTEFTAIIKSSEVLNKDASGNPAKTIVAKYDEVGGGFGAFLFRYNKNINSYELMGGGKTVSRVSFSPTLVNYINTETFNGIPIEHSGTFRDSSNLFLGVSNNSGNPLSSYGSFYIYYFALYSRSLTEPQIQAEIQKLESLWSSRLNN